MTTYCTCWACTDFRTPYYKRTDAELFDIVQNKFDDRHRLARVSAYIELMYRYGDGEPGVNYRIWRSVMGDVPPPVSNLGIGAFPVAHDWNNPWSWH